MNMWQEKREKWNVLFRRSKEGELTQGKELIDLRMSDNKEGKNDGIPQDGKEALLAGRLAVVRKMNERIMVLKLGASYRRRK